MSDQKDIEKGSFQPEEKVALKDAENCSQATGDHEKSGINGKETVKVVDPTTPKQEFCGLTKEELQQFAKDPFWRRVRLILFAGFWIAWLAMLLAAIIIIIVAPKCPKRPNLKWWEKSLFYRVCPRTYKDSNGDGSGDFKGLTEKLSYIHDDVQSNAIILTPIFKSAYKDLGFDVTSLDTINEVFGTDKDFEDLLAKAHKKNMKVVLDFVVNNVDMENSWWKNDEKNKFIFRDATSSLDNLYGGKSWNAHSGQNYYSTVTKELPDLNLNNSEVFSAVEKSLRKWLKLGVDGIRIPYSPYLVEPAEEVTKENRKFSAETYNFIEKIGKVVNDFDDRVFIADIGKLKPEADKVQRLYKSGVDLVDSLNLAKMKDDSKLDMTIFDNIKRTLNITEKRWSIWNLGNEDASRFGTNTKNWYLRQMIGMLLKGTSIVYYGNELAMENSEADNNHDQYRKNEDKRDKYRAPMMWTDDDNTGGFTDGDESWMKVDKRSLPILCVACQKAKKTSFLKFFTSLAKLRQEPSFQWGDLIFEPSDNNKLLVFIRQAIGFQGYMVVINLDETYRATVDLTNHKENLPDKAKVILSTNQDDYKIDESVDLKNFGLPSKTGVVLRWEANDWKVE